MHNNNMIRKQRDRIENFTMVTKVEDLTRNKKSRINLIGGGTRFLKFDTNKYSFDKNMVYPCLYTFLYCHPYFILQFYSLKIVFYACNT